MRKIPLTTFSAGVLVDEHTWKAPFSWGSIFAGPTVKVCIHRDKILQIYSQHYFIIMLSTPPPKQKQCKMERTAFLLQEQGDHIRGARISSLTVFLWESIMSCHSMEHPYVCVCARMQVRVSNCLYLLNNPNLAQPPRYHLATSICLWTSFYFFF